MSKLPSHYMCFTQRHHHVDCDDDRFMRIAYLIPGMLFLLLASLMVLAYLSAAQSTWFLAVTPFRILAIRSGGFCCNPGMMCYKIPSICIASTYELTG
jgi:hypothetical protein